MRWELERTFGQLECDKTNPPVSIPVHMMSENLKQMVTVEHLKSYLFKLKHTSASVLEPVKPKRNYQVNWKVRLEKMNLRSKVAQAMKKL